MSDTTATAAEALPHLPFYVSAPGTTDWLFVGIGIFLLAVIFLLLVFYLHLHSLPDKMAHEVNHTQLQVVGILTLLALFTHNNLFWVAGLLLASIQFPDFATPLNSVARSLASLSDAEARRSAAVQPATESVPSPAGDVGTTKATNTDTDKAEHV